MKTNYDKLADRYADSREIDGIVYSVLCYMLKPSEDDLILDFGCGTGNYLRQLVSDYNIKSYGVDQSINMCLIAQNKIFGQNIKRGVHIKIPFPELLFNKIYCIDVIHHIHDIDILFRNLFTIASLKAQFCICTESPQQLDKKYWLRYFPSISKVDCERFHTIDSIIHTGTNTGWKYKEIVSTENRFFGPISYSFMKCVELKTLSALCLISNEEYEKGLLDMKSDYNNSIDISQCDGYTFILLEKENV